MIYAIVMSGGRGTRLNSPVEKPLFNLCNKPLIKHTLDNLNASKYIDKLFIATSPNTPKTREYVEGLSHDFLIFDTPGISYLNDLSFILESFEKNSKNDSLLFINADLPFISTDLIDYTIEKYNSVSEDALSVLVPVEIFKELDLPYSYEFEGLVPSGLNILRSENIVQDEYKFTIPKKELALNVNTLKDAKIAEEVHRDL
ncbi:MAG: NTP transferase domain-containing protein [Methanobrevibacter sp.]|uniref:NTP transferase domain-containing protein n=1 Tax=Methanobrevibacter sp. TaxID=66852 RepID=UPI0026DEFDAA|nr:NTP transferase domain-containing protein [Methanobrevibacter sp.]MDO5848155.1 NTP transferase domain-containing protein [Methanobrevibacter sp.]